MGPCERLGAGTMFIYRLQYRLLRAAVASLQKRYGTPMTHYYVPVFEMTYTVSSGTLNSKPGLALSVVYLSMFYCIVVY